MEPQNKPMAKDFFLNLGAIIALGVSIGNLVSLLFTVINKAYPSISANYYSSSSISFSVATLIIVFPVYILFVWLLERDYLIYSELKKGLVRRWLTFITLFISGGVLIGDLVTVLYYFIDGRDMTTSFLMKAFVVLIIFTGTFCYYIFDMLGKINSFYRKIWVGISLLIVILSIIWGFSILGSPRTQRLYKYDEQKVNDLMTISNEINNYYYTNRVLPENISELNSNYYIPTKDRQTGNEYKYIKIGELSYDVCATFNKDSVNNENYYNTWVHNAGEYCFNKKVNKK